jgi:hypothetical protein
VSSGSSGDGQLGVGEYEHRVKVALSSDEDVANGTIKDAQHKDGDVHDSKDGDVTSRSGGDGQLGVGKEEHRVKVATSLDKDVVKGTIKDAQQMNGDGHDSEDGDVSSGSGGNGKLGDGKEAGAPDAGGVIVG